jgi:gamma-glutamylcyclotransferase (GGCT)/AIG2-like uncharacterized protein YtfP
MTGPVSHVFVYGTLKRGHGNHRLLADNRVIGEAVSLDRYMMWGQGIPFIAPDDDDGSPVAGELYEVDADTLAKLDRLEGHPDWYCRELRSFTIAGETCTAWVYLARHHDRHQQQPNDPTGGVHRWGF